MKNQYFDIQRLGWYLRRQAYMYSGPIMITIGAVLGFILLITCLVAWFNPDGLLALKWFYLTVFFIVGYILTSKSYSELNSKQSAYAFLTLPASTFEKFIGSWLLSAPAYFIAYSAAISVIFTIGNFIASIKGFTFPLTEIFDHQYLRSAGVFFVTQTIVLVGAAYFHGNNLVKTVFSLFVLQLLIGIYVGINVLLFFGSSFQNFEGNSNFEFTSFVENTIPHVMHIFFWGILGPFMLIVSYLKLKEREV